MNFFATCSQCGARSELYGSMPSCRDCGDTVCVACQQPGSEDEERGTAACKKCAADEKEAA